MENKLPFFICKKFTFKNNKLALNTDFKLQIEKIVDNKVVFVLDSSLDAFYLPFFAAVEKGSNGNHCMFDIVNLEQNFSYVDVKNMEVILYQFYFEYENGSKKYYKHSKQLLEEVSSNMIKDIEKRMDISNGLYNFLKGDYND